MCACVHFRMSRNDDLLFSQIEAKEPTLLIDPRPSIQTINAFVGYLSAADSSQIHYMSLAEHKIQAVSPCPLILYTWLEFAH